MAELGALLEACMNGMKMPITIYGHTFSFWEIFVFTIVIAIFGIIIGGLLSE